MSIVPQVKPGDWIAVGSIDCIVTEMRQSDLTSANVQIICNSERPAVYVAQWEHGAWSFTHPMRGDYADHVPGLEPYIELLRIGRPET